MKICIIGAGITGLTLGRILSDKHNVIILEKEKYIGGIARTKKVNGVAYHVTGGHCFNSRNPNILKFVFNHILSQDKWHKIKRVAKIFFKGFYISYPIEYSIKEIAHFDEELAYKITCDFFRTEDNPNNKAKNLAEWFILSFGETLAKEYFIPYNKKIWKLDPENMSHNWVVSKLPMPNKKKFFKALLSESCQDEMPHREFYYPTSNDMNDFINALGSGLNIINNFNVTSIERKNNKWLINNKLEFDLVISTVPLNEIVFLVKNTPVEILNQAKKLKYNKVTTMLWKSKPTEYTWTYFPSEEILFHRCIHIGNFFIPKQNYTITEAIGEHSQKTMIDEGRKLEFLVEPIDYHVSNHAYVVFDENREKAVKIIKDYLNRIGLYTTGRFGDWDYYNMDVCMEKAFTLVKELKLI